jgi:hypothetical protein
MNTVLRLLMMMGLLLRTALAWGQGPAWQGLAGAVGGPARVAATVADGNGYVYVAGAFSGTMSFGGVSLTGTGTNNLFVAKWNQTTNRCEWARSAGSTGQLTARAVATAGGAVYLAGDFAGTVTFDGTALTSTGPSNVFVAKLSQTGSTGTFAWAEQAGSSTGTDMAYGVAAQGSSVYMVGRFTGSTASFGGVTLTNVSSSGPEAFVAKLTDAGATASFAWAQRLGGTNNDEALAVAVYGSSVYLAGYFQGALVGWGNGVQTAPSTVGVNSDAFVAKVTDNGTNGSPGWVVRAGGAGAEQALALAATSTGPYVTGYFTSTAPDFGALTLANSGPASSADLFVGKLADAGATATFIWVRQSGGTADELGTALAVQGNQVYMAGAFGNSQVGSVGASFGATQLVNVGLRDVFVAKITDAGPSSAFAWALGAGGAGNDTAAALAISGTNVLVGGYAVAPATFGPLALSGAPTGPTGWLAWVADATLTAAAPAAAAQLLTIYPNPAHAMATVRLPATPGTAQATLTLLDALGRPVRTQGLLLPAVGTTAELLLAGLAPGLYYLQMQAGGQQASRMLVVE